MPAPPQLARTPMTAIKGPPETNPAIAKGAPPILSISPTTPGTSAFSEYLCTMPCLKNKTCTAA